MGKRPNVILIVVDAARPDHFSCYGCKRETTPNIDRLAEEGTLYENTISSSSWTLPAVSSLLTGTYALQHKSLDYYDRLDPDIKTLAQVLGKVGYKTAAIHAGLFFDRIWDTDRGFQEINRKVIYNTESTPLILKAIRKLRSKLSLQNDNGAGWIEKNLRSWFYRQDKPFFLYLHYMEPHDKFGAPIKYSAKYLNGPSDFLRGLKLNRKEASIRSLMDERKPDERDVRILNALYDGALNYLDMRVGKVVGMLKEKGVLDDTILVITADHGENLGDHGMVGHQWCLYDSLIRVPFIVRYPEVFAKGRRMSELAQNVDLFPTLMEVLNVPGADVPAQLAGQNLLSLKRQYAFSEWGGCGIAAWQKRYPQFDFSPYDRTLRSVRSLEHKLIWSSDKKHELYDLKRDPGETRNLVEDLPEKVKELNQVLAEWLGSFTKLAAAQQNSELTSAVKRKLQALGYLG